jgi:outer membrane protein OmpA-like peptidoglycan-associated protein
MPVPPDSPRSEAEVARRARKTPPGVWFIMTLAVFLVVAGLGISAFIILKALGERKPVLPVAVPESTARPETTLETGPKSTTVPNLPVVASLEVPQPVERGEEEETRQEVLKRIDVKKDLSERDKDQLYVQVQKARGFFKIAVVPFAEGKISAGPSQIELLINRLRQKDVQDRLKDPTTLLFVLGFADLQGDEAKNLEISRNRAESVIRELRTRTDLVNVIHPVSMGGQNLIDSTKPERNRLVEVWLAQP